MPTASAETRIRLQKILFATDFSFSSENALAYARDFARLYGSSVVVAHVAAPVPFESDGIQIDYAQFERAVQKELQYLGKQFGEVKHRSVLLEGSPWPELQRLLKAETMDLIVTATHGRTGAQRFLLGSVAEEIFRNAECPVLTVGPFVRRHPLAKRRAGVEATGGLADSNLRTVLFATDFSKAAAAAAPYAISLAREHAAELVLLHVIEQGKNALHDGERVEGYLRSELKKLIASEEEPWCTPEFLVEHGEPATVILEVAQRSQADLIVLGVRSAKGHMLAATHLARATAHEVVAHATAPVLTVRERV